MPYLYSVVREGCVSGLPIIRASLAARFGRPGRARRGDEFLFGPDILVAPVTDKGATSRRALSAAGIWYDYWSEKRVEGGQEIRRPVDLATIPLHARAGAIIPLGPVKQYTGEQADGPLSLSVYPGVDGHFLLYEDDGVSFNYRKGDWMGIELKWDDSARKLTMQLADGSNMRPPLDNGRIEVRLIPGKETRSVVFAGKPIETRW